MGWVVGWKLEKVHELRNNPHFSQPRRRRHNLGLQFKSVDDHLYGYIRANQTTTFAFGSVLLHPTRAIWLGLASIGVKGQRSFLIPNAGSPRQHAQLRRVAKITACRSLL